MTTDLTDPLEITRDRLGEPEATFRVGAGRFWGKFALGAALVAYGVAANALAWRWGVWGVDHVTLLVLFAPPITGLSVLRHLFASRGLAYLVYPTGLVRVRGRELTAFPWGDLDGLTVRADSVTPLVTADGGRVTGCRLLVTAPALRLGSASVTLRRRDGETAEVTAAVAEYPRLVEEVTARTFAEEWPRLLEELTAGGSRAFGPWTAVQAGLHLETPVVPWGELRLARSADKYLTVERLGGRPGRWAAALESIPSPHLLIALLAVAQADPAA